MAHRVGCNAISWAPALAPFTSGSIASPAVKMFATGGCDNNVMVWKEEGNAWKSEVIGSHENWVRDVAWSHNIGVSSLTLASCSQDKKVLLWSAQSDKDKFTQKELKKDPFPDVVWRVSWSVTGTLLAVSCGDNKVYLYKESLEGEWECLSEVQEIEASGAQSQGGR